MTKDTLRNYSFAIGRAFTSLALFAQILEILKNQSSANVSFWMAILVVIGFCFMLVRSIATPYKVWWILDIFMIVVGLLLFSLILWFK